MDDVGDQLDERITRRITVSGHVQGVGFRWFARESARALGVSGWARNLPDGSVLVEAGGRGAALERFIEVLRAGPPYAHVADVLVEPRRAGEPLPDHFTILR